MTTPTPTEREVARLLELAENATEIDQSAKAGARVAMRAAYSPAAGDDSEPVVIVDVLSGSDVGKTELVRMTRTPRRGHRGRFVALVAVAAALIIFFTITFREPDQERIISPASTSVPTTPELTDDTTETVTPEEIGAMFMQARSDYDSATLVSLMAPDASFSVTELAQSVEEIPLQTEWERAVGWRYTDWSCSVTSPGVVRCSYRIQAPINERLALGPYEGNSYRFEISDGRIQYVDHNLNVFDFYTDTEVGFYAWITQNHPDDFAVMNEGDRLLGGDYPSFPNLTPQSIQLWESHAAEYLASLE